MSPVHDTIRPVRYAWTALLVALCGACSETTRFSTASGPVDGGLDAQIEEDAAVDAGLSLGEAGQALCNGRPCACSNGVDDDDDDLADGFDSECTGPFDDDEGSFRVNDVNEGNQNCTDCFYDGDHRRGNDGCDISTQCTVDGTFGNGGGTCRTCDANLACRTNCEQITPNGCDCFGCCEVTYEGTTVPIRLIASCDMKKLSDTNACPRCRINTSCHNPCEMCELCPGTTLADLPMTCMNAVACGERTRCKATGECTFSEFCSQGCCVPILL
jgi:hypothetical protein